MFFIIAKKKILYSAGLVLVCILTGTVISKAVQKQSPNNILVIIDAGHGEPDGGCVGALGTIEQEINLSVAKKTAEILEAKGINTLLTRNNSLGLWTEKSTTIRQKKLEDMKNRLSVMSKAHGDLFISIHMNSYPDHSAQGHRIFYDRKHSEIKTLAESIQLRICDVTSAKSHPVTAAGQNLFLLKDSPLPAILIECGFLSNPSEEQKLQTSEYQAKLAWAISDAIEKYFLQCKINQ